MMSQCPTTRHWLQTGTRHWENVGRPRSGVSFLSFLSYIPSMAFYGLLWPSMAFYGLLWPSMAFYGQPGSGFHCFLSILPSYAMVLRELSQIWFGESVLFSKLNLFRAKRRNRWSRSWAWQGWLPRGSSDTLDFVSQWLAIVAARFWSFLQI